MSACITLASWLSRERSVASFPAFPGASNAEDQDHHHHHVVSLTGALFLLQVLSKRDDANWGWNAATDQYEDLMAAGIIDPTKVRLS